MKTTTMIALLTVVSAVSVGAISMSENSSFALATGGVTPEVGTMMGHVEYIVRDSSGNIVQYQQLDNMVVNQGDNCVITAAFQTTAAGGSDVGCTFSSDGFRFIGIGNDTQTIAATHTTLSNTATTTASSGAAGIMAVRADANTVGSASSNGGTVIIATETPFTFTDGTITNATAVKTAGLFDATCSGNDATHGYCTANSGTMNMFAAQAIDVTVGDGDSLDVTWTITVGNSS